MKVSTYKRFYQISEPTAVSGKIKDRESEERGVHPIQCAQQGQIVHWEENVAERQLSRNLELEYMTLSFLVVRSTYDVLPTPENLVRWNVANDEVVPFGVTSNADVTRERTM